MPRSIVVSLVLCLGVIASACAEDDPALRGGGEHGGHEEDAGEGHAAQGTLSIGGEEATNHGGADVAGMTEFELELDDSYFGPTVVEGEAGQELALGLYNEGGMAHTFTIDGVVDEELPSGADGISIDIAFPDSGALLFYCRFHRQQGMLGALSVGGSLELRDAAGSTPTEDANRDY